MSDRPTRLPLPAGRPVVVDGAGKVVLTDLERAEFAKYGVADPSPGQVEHMRKAAEAFMEKDRRRLESESPADPSRPPPRFDESKVIPWDDLDEERKAELTASLAELKEIGRRKRPGPAPSPMALQVPGLPEALEAADAPATDPAGENSVIPEEPPGHSHTGAAATPRACPRCKWDLSKKDVLEVDREDRLAYYASLYGARFKKSYAHFGGDLRLVFRTLEAEEQRLMHEQVQRDLQARPDAPAALYFSLLFEYTLALKLERIEFADGRQLVVPADRFLKGRPEGAATPLQGLLAYVRANVLKHESLARIAARYLEHFNRLVEQLEADADRGFTTEIGGPA